MSTCDEAVPSQIGQWIRGLLGSGWVVGAIAATATAAGGGPWVVLGVKGDVSFRVGGETSRDAWLAAVAEAAARDGRPAESA